MTSQPVEIAAGLWRWTARHPEWHPGEFGRRVAAFALRADNETLLVDPLLPEDDPAQVVEALDALVGARVAILVTIPYHTRSAEPLAARYRATIYGHPATAKRLADASAFRPAKPGDALPGGARAFTIGRPRRSEQPLWLPSHRAVAFGDAVVGVDGGLRVWAHAAVDDRMRRFHRERFAPTLEPLVELGPERALVGHGEPVLSNARAALAAALATDPWTRRG
jgi:glyoxylase-like metal-dependent hydrolase (beta-lactamase superfamily II)